MLKRKLNKIVSVTLALLLVLSRINAGAAGYTDAGKSLSAVLISKPAFSYSKDSGSLNTDIKSLSSSVSIPLHPSIADFTDDYIEKNDESFEKLKQNNRHTIKIIDKILKQFDLPQELKYLAVVESRLKYNAVSRSGAVGLWQFMPETAKRFGLKITTTNDDRKNIWKSSVAAAKYLDKLYDCFGDWLLVIAAYNSGPAPVLKAIKKSGSRNFWQLQYYLPRESRMHVKKFIATHYYFEGKGSMVTMGKEETEKYLEALQTDNTTGKDESGNSKVPVNNSQEHFRITGWVAIVTDEKYPKLIVKK